MSLINSRFHQVLEAITFILIMNVLWFITSLTIIGFLPATFALFILSKDMIINRDNQVIKPFFQTIKNYIWRANAIGIPSLLVLFSLSYYLLVFAAFPGEWAIFLFSLSLTAIVLYLIFLGHLLPLFAYANYSFKIYVKRAFWFIFYKPWYSLLLLAGAALVLFITSLLPVLILLGSASLFAYIVTSIFLKKMEVLESQYPQIWDHDRKE